MRSVKSNTVSIRNNHRPILRFEHPLQAAQVHCSRLPKPTATASKGVAFTAMFRLSMLVSTANLSALQTCGQLPFPDADSHASSFVKKDDAHEPNPHLLSSQRSLPLIASACLKLQGSGGVVRKHAVIMQHFTALDNCKYKLLQAVLLLCDLSPKRGTCFASAGCCANGEGIGVHLAATSVEAVDRCNKQLSLWLCHFWLHSTSKCLAHLHQQRQCYLPAQSLPSRRRVASSHANASCLSRAFSQAEMAVLKDSTSGISSARGISS